MLCMLCAIIVEILLDLIPRSIQQCFHHMNVHWHCKFNSVSDNDYPGCIGVSTLGVRGCGTIPSYIISVMS